MNFAKTIKAIKYKEARREAGEEVFVSLIEEIDKELVRPTRFEGEAARKNAMMLASDLKVGDIENALEVFNVLYDQLSNTRPRAKGVFHPSSLEGDCPRMLWYEIQEEPITDKVFRGIDAKLQRTFDQGTWFHLYIQQKLINAGVLEKAEVLVHDEEWKISGRGDGIVLMPDRRLLEIKTCSSFSFKKALIGPFETHKKQVCVYQTILQKTYPDLKHVHFLYFNKDTSEMIEHLYVPEKEIIDAQFGKMKLVLESKSEPKRDCANNSCPQAMNCPYRTKCFK